MNARAPGATAPSNDTAVTPEQGPGPKLVGAAPSTSALTGRYVMVVDVEHLVQTGETRRILGLRWSHDAD